MNNIHCFTSISFNYLAKARVLAWSLKRFHPDWTLWVCISDREPPGCNFNIDEEVFDRVLWGDELPIDNIKGWLFKHDVVELCTAVKGPVMAMLAERSGADKIFYLDPDIAVFSPLDSLVNELEENDILLTPHQLAPEKSDHESVENEIASLQHGIYNLGFVAINASGCGVQFANWWRDRLTGYCYDDVPRGLFVDQRWCDLVPALFEKVAILRDAGLNVASWNLSQRKIEITVTGEILVNGDPLKFYHFTKIYGVGLTMINKYAEENIHIYELISWYKKMVNKYTDENIENSWWHYGTYANGKPVLREHRLLYRSREEFQEIYKDPFEVGEFSYYQWLIQNEKEWKCVFQNNDGKGGSGGIEEGASRKLGSFIARSRWARQCHQAVEEMLVRKIGEVIVFGAGEVGRTLVPAAKARGIKVKYVVDRNPILWGQQLEGVEIVSLNKALTSGLKTYVVASLAFAGEISELILESHENADFTPEILVMGR